MISRTRLRRWLAPTLDLGGGVAAAMVGIVVLITGVFVSFREFLHPVLRGSQEVFFRLVGGMLQIESQETSTHLLGGMMMLLGLVLSFAGVRAVFRSVIRTLSPGMTDRMTTTYVRRQQLARGPKIVAMGGGTGLSTLLRGLKQHSSNISAIVTVTDDGGSSGRLSEELGIIPPGDLRNCLVALADAEKRMTDLFQVRFKGESKSLSGHSLGNLLIAGLIELNGGDFEKALNMASEVLAIRGRVMPSTLDRVRLRALLESGEEICGETAIVQAGGRIRRLFVDPPDCPAFPDALQAIQDAELIVVGPGSVYTSIIPNLLVSGVADAVRASRAVKVYVCNVMTQPGESQGFTAQEHVAAIEANAGEALFDYVLVNTERPSVESLARYEREDQYFVEPDLDRIVAGGKRPIPGRFISESDYVRHDPLRVAQAVVGVLNR